MQKVQNIFDEMRYWNVTLQSAMIDDVGALLRMHKFVYKNRRLFALQVGIPNNDRWNDSGCGFLLLLLHNMQLLFKDT
jgi:hypothetical protein